MALARQLIGGTLADVPRPPGDGTPEDEGSNETEEEAETEEKEEEDSIDARARRAGGEAQTARGGAQRDGGGVAEP